MQTAIQWLTILTLTIAGLKAVPCLALENLAKGDNLLTTEAAPVAAEPEPVVALTKNAAAQIKKVMQDKKLPADTLLRVGVAQGGKTGFQYTLSFAKKSEKAAADLEAESFGVRIIVDPRSSLFLQGTKIDYEDKPKPGFRFENPNAVKEGK